MLKKLKKEYNREELQDAYKYGIYSVIMYLSSIFAEKRFDDSSHLGLGDIRITIGEQEEILDQLENLKDREYPTTCGTCGGRLE